MPITVHCTCGSTFDVPDSYAGRTAHCIGCGVQVGVPDLVGSGTDGLIPLADEGPNDAALRQPGPRLEATAASTAVPVTTVSTSAPPSVAEPSSGDPRLATRRDARRDVILPPDCTFWHDAVRSFAVFLKPENTVICLIVWFLHLIWGSLSYLTVGVTANNAAFATSMILITILVKILLAGVLCSFYLNIIVETARGEDHLPPLAIEDSPWDDIVRPLLLFLGSWFAVMLPAMLLAYSGVSSPMIPTLAVVAGGIGVFLWPITILTVAVGDSLRALRPDLIVATVARTFLPYLAVWAILAVAVALLLLPILVGDLGLLQGTPMARVPWGSWVAHVAACVFSGFLLIIMMRIVGLYYRHFKSSFAWHAE